MNDLDRDRGRRGKSTRCGDRHAAGSDRRAGRGSPRCCRGGPWVMSLTHIARNAEGHVRMFERGRAWRGGGDVPGRARATQPATSRPARAGPQRRLAADVTATAGQTRSCVGRRCPTDAWAGRGVTIGGEIDDVGAAVHPLAGGDGAPRRSRSRLLVVGLGCRVRATGAGAADDVVGQSQADGHDRPATRGDGGDDPPASRLAARVERRSMALPRRGS